MNEESGSATDRISELPPNHVMGAGYVFVGTICTLIGWLTVADQSIAYFGVFALLLGGLSIYGHYAWGVSDAQ